MGNYSRSPQTELATALNNDYCRVRFQQGKPALDRELNLAADLASPQRLAGAYLGNGIAGSGMDFAITNLNVAGNDFTIGAGRCLVNGLEAVLRANTTYATQPNRANVAPLPAGTSNVYLRVSEREVTSAEDPALANAGDVTFETAIRNKVDWEVKVSAAPIASPDHVLLAVITTGPPTIADRRRLNLNAAATRDEVTSARGAAPDLATRLNASLGANGALLAVTVAAAQLKLVPRFTGTATVAANGEQRINAFAGSRHATLFVSVVVSNGTGGVFWSEFALGAPVPARGVRIQNPGATPLTVDVQVFELQAT